MSRAATPTKPGPTDGWDYVAYRGDLLAQLALARLPGVNVFRPQADGGWDYLVATPDGVTFAVVVKAYSPLRHPAGAPADGAEQLWTLDRPTVDRARHSRTPVVLFVFDADAEHGRYLRLDTLPAPAGGTQRVTVGLPAANRIDARSLERFVSELRHRSEPAAAGHPRP